jgi:hypothetical protein
VADKYLYGNAYPKQQPKKQAKVNADTTNLPACPALDKSEQIVKALSKMEMLPL